MTRNDVHPTQAETKIRNSRVKMRELLQSQRCLVKAGVMRGPDPGTGMPPSLQSCV